MLRILDITAPDINNGNGIRVTLWVAGCKHHCKGCHNQWTWDFNQGKPLTDDKFGKEISNQLENWLSRDYVEGLTISGGDPLCQDEDALYELNEIILWVHQEMQKNVWIYTGYVYEDLLKEIENNPSLIANLSNDRLDKLINYYEKITEEKQNKIEKLKISLNNEV